jgi:hypothetical protein
MLLVSYNDEYCEYFNVHGFILIKKDDWDNVMIELKKLDVYRHHFGSDHHIDYDSIDDMIETFTIRTVSERESKVLKDMFERIEKGVGQWPRELSPGFDHSVI